MNSPAMGYRRLISKYMQHVKDHTGNAWLSDTPKGELTARDISELRAIWMTIERELEADTSSDYNQRAKAMCEEHEIATSDVARHLGWSTHIVKEWFVSTDDPRHRKMTKRDFEHFFTCITHTIPSAGRDS